MLSIPGNCVPSTKNIHLSPVYEIKIGRSSDQSAQNRLFIMQAEAVNYALDDLRREIELARNREEPFPSDKAMIEVYAQLLSVVKKLLPPEGLPLGRELFVTAALEEDGGVEINGSYVGELGCLIERIAQNGQRMEAKRIVWINGKPKTIYEGF